MERHFRHEQGCQRLVRADDLCKTDGDSTRAPALQADWLTGRRRARDDKETDTRNRADLDAHPLYQERSGTQRTHDQLTGN
ncbi:hypothetical protein CLCR_09359 [Cladophialophora carrionii]|uniref:Uncharacterized protein n=1 Tax=Cladophialophora carrionii TaxID=86049 RepID=A0A1C1CT62_9EURO|nr:hypothetical protein CLCR_09359 [Cladophialophora carrionii]